MIQPGRYDITLQQGATFEMAVQYKDSDGTPVNMSGYTISGSLWNRLGTNKLATFSTPYVSQPSGMFVMRLEASVTSGITEQGQYDVLVTTAEGDKYYLLEGSAFWSEGFSWRS
jgi:hypothetical protein